MSATKKGLAKGPALSNPSSPLRHSEVRFALATIGIVFGMIAFGAVAAETVPPSSQPQILASQVREIFAAKCVECHDAATAKPRGDFGYVLDLAQIAANPDMVIPGDPEHSELYLMVQNDEMPGDEATVPPLTTSEKEVVRRWIETGASADIAVPVTFATPAPAAKKPLSTGERIVRFLGNLHPASSHFPIALLIAALPAEFMWKRTRKPTWKAAVRFCVTLAAGSGVVTASLGWCDGAFTSYTGASAETLFWHRWIGTGTAVWAVLTAALSEFAHREQYPRGLRYAFRVTLVVGILLVSLVGYLGATLVYGPNHLRW